LADAETRKLPALVTWRDQSVRIFLRFNVPSSGKCAIKHEGQFVKTPGFQILFRRLLGRLSSLSRFHDGRRSFIMVRWPTGTKTGTGRFGEDSSSRKCLISLVGGAGFEPAILGL
jgi:hypothetical protein